VQSPPRVCKIGVATAQACILLDSITWTVLEVLRSAIVAMGWEAASAYLYQDSGVVHHLLEIGHGLWPLIWSVVGQA
jgi:hypothetical protein